MGRLNDQGNAAFVISICRVAATLPECSMPFLVPVFLKMAATLALMALKNLFSIQRLRGIKTAGDEPLPYARNQPRIQHSGGFGKTLKVQGVSRTLEVEIYRIDWNWWWSGYERSVAQYMRQQHRTPLPEYECKNYRWQGRFQLLIPENDWGRYYVKVSDPVSGHSSGELWYFDWPSMAGRAGRSAPDGASMLTFTTDKDVYKPGDKARITFPSSAGASAIISIENGTKVIRIDFSSDHRQ
jgi:hypothetical protein